MLGVPKAVCRFVLATIMAICGVAAPGGTDPAWAQNPVFLGGPLTGEVVLNRDVEVRIAPNENARIVMTLDEGKPLNALGTPRGTSWTQVAIGGQPIGYVPADSLDPALAVRPLPLPTPSGGKGGASPSAGAGAAGGMGGGMAAGADPRSGAVAALVPRAAWERGQNARARGYVVAWREVPGATVEVGGKKNRIPAMDRGVVAGLLDVDGDRARVALPGGGRRDVPIADLIGVLTGYPLPGQAPLGTGTLYAARLGEYITHAEGVRAWDTFVKGPGGGFRSFQPQVWPVFRDGDLVYQMGIGPFNQGELDNVCPLLARAGFACSIIELVRF